MGSRIQCFLLTPTPLLEISLRRFTFSSKQPCVDNSYHNAEALIGQEEGKQPRGDAGGLRFPKDDPRWPKRCEKCGYAFQPEEEWQENYHRLYSGAPDGKLYTLWNAPAGAMWFTEWRTSGGSIHHQQRGGGAHLFVRTPGGDWDVDSKSSNGDGWTRTGEPPNVTAHPSIGAGKGEKDGYKYHGWLRNGWLEEC